MKKKRSKSYNPNKHVAPDVLSPTHQNDLIKHSRNAMIAMRLGRATEAHGYDIGTALMIGYQAASLVERHRHLVPVMDDALAALTQVQSRWMQRTIKDGFYSGTEAEIAVIDSGIVVYAALVRTCSGHTMRQAINRVAILTNQHRKAA